jgi:hypothetical protein
MTRAALNLDHFIALDKRYIRILLPVGFLLVFIGLLGLSGLFRVVVTAKASDAVDMIVKAFGLLVSVIGLYPFNNCYVRWERIQTLRAINLNPDALDYSRASSLFQEVKSLEAQLADTKKALTASQQKLLESQKALADSQQQLVEAQAQAAKTKAELAKANDELAQAKEDLSEALDLEQYIYHLNWGELKPMYMEYGSAAEILHVINDLKDDVHWNSINDPTEKAYNSPGFATLVLHKLGRLPANDTLAKLPRDTGPANVGDIVVYEGGYHLFYFRNRSNEQFVVGMTPFGVTALTYDFGSKIIDVLRTGLSTRR